MPWGEDSDTANDYPEVWQGQETDPVKHHSLLGRYQHLTGFQSSTAQAHSWLSLLKSALIGTLQGLGADYLTLSAPVAVVQQYLQWLWRVTWCWELRKNSFPSPRRLQCSTLHTDRRLWDKASLCTDSLAGGEALCPRRCHQQTATFSFWLRNWGFCYCLVAHLTFLPNDKLS